MGVERLLAVVGGGFAVGLGARHFVVGRPVAAGVNGVEGAVEGGAVFLKQGWDIGFSWGGARSSRKGIAKGIRLVVTLQTYRYCVNTVYRFKS